MSTNPPGRSLAHRGARARDGNRACLEAGFWTKVRRTLGRVPFVEEAVAAYFCALDPATPAQVKAVLIGALAYFVLPADMIPDFIAGLGFSDDAAVLYAALRTVAPHIDARHRARAREALDKLETVSDETA